MLRIQSHSLKSLLMNVQPLSQEWSRYPDKRLHLLTSSAQDHQPVGSHPYCLQQFFMQFTKQDFVASYNNLSTESLKSEANTYIIRLTESDQAWNISRELLADPNNQQQIFGAQMLHRKTQNNFSHLTPQQQTELASYVFSVLFQICGTASKSTIAKLAGTCAIIVAYGSHNPSSFGAYLSELTQAMKASPAHLRAGLDVIKQIPYECKELRTYNPMQKKVVKNTILAKSSNIISLFCSVFETKQIQTVTKNLECLVEWADFGLPIMSNPQLVDQILASSIKTYKNLDLATQILASAFKYNFYEGAQTLDNSALTKQELNSNYLSSIVKIVRFILQSREYLIEEMNSQYLYMYGFLIKQLLLYHPWIIVQDFNNVGKPLLELMLIVLQQKSLKISSISMDFWTNLYKKIPNIQGIQTHIVNIYSAVYERVIKKTLRKELPSHLIKDAQEEERCEDETDDDGDNMQKVTFQDYRTNSGFLYQAILFVFKRIPSGVDLFFKSISDLLQSNDQCQIQLGLFIAHSTLNVIKDEPNQVVPVMIDYSCNFINTNPNIKRHVVKLFSLLTDEIRQYDKFQKVLAVTLNYLADSELQQLTSKLFDLLMHKMPKHANIDLVEKMMQYCKVSLRILNNSSILTKVLEGVVKLIQKLQDQQLSIGYLKVLLQNSITNLVRVLQNNQLNFLELSVYEIDLYLNQFQTLYKQKHPTASLAGQYYASILSLLPRIFQICKMGNLKYSSINSLGVSTDIYCQITKMMGTRNLQNLDIVTICTSLSCINPKQNCQLLKILSTTIQQSSGSGASLPLLDNWISQHFLNFVRVYLGLIQSTQDSDVIRNFFNVLEKVTKYNPIIFLNIPENMKIVELATRILVNVIETRMSKTVLEFIYLVLRIPNLNMQPLYNNILMSIFLSMQNFGSNGYLTAAQIVIHVLSGQTQQSLNVILAQMFQQTPMKSLEKLALVIKILSFFIFTKDQSNLRSSFILIGITLKDCGQNQIVNLEMKYEAAKRALKYRS